MIICPNCLKKLNDGTHYCDECGFDLLHEAPTLSDEELRIREEEERRHAEQIANNTENPEGADEETVAEEPVAEHNSEDDYLNIDGDGDDMPYDRVKSKKRNSRKVRRFNKKKTIKIVSITLAAIIVVSAALLALAIIFAENVYPGYALYVKNGDLMYRRFDSAAAVELPINADDIMDFDVYGKLCRISEDGNILIFPKEYQYGDDTMDLCYLNLGNKNAAPVDIGYNAIIYSVNESADTVTYLRKHSDGNKLFRYTAYNNGRVPLASGVENFVASDDGESVIYFQTGSAIYRFDGNSSAKISKGGTIAFAADKKLYYYMEEEAEDGLYYKQALYYFDGKQSVKVLDDCLNIITVIDELDTALVEAFDDDGEIVIYYVANGAATKIKLMNPDFFVYNYWIDEDGKTMYFLDDVDENENEDYTDDTEPFEAILYKAELSKKEIKKIEEIDEDVNGGQFVAKDKFVYFKNTFDPYGLWAADVYLNDELVDTEVNGIIGIDGKKLIYIKDYDNEAETYSLYKAGENIATGIIGAFMMDGDVIHVTESDPESYDDLYSLYDGDKLISDEIYDFDISAEDKIVFYTDLDENKGCGTLNIYQDGNVKSYGGDVFCHEVTRSHDVVYFKDVDSMGVGDMYYVKDGAEVRLEKNIDTYYLDMFNCMYAIFDSNYVVIEDVLAEMEE